MDLGRVDDDVDLAADLAGQLARPSDRCVRSSGTSVTSFIALMSSKPGSFFHGSAWPTQTMSAPALTSACTIAWPTAALPSVTSTLRNFGSLVISRSIRSSAMCSLPSVGNPISTAWPARSSRAPTLTRAGALADLAVQVDDQRRPGVELHQPQPPRQAFAKEQVVAVVKRGGTEQACLRRSGRATGNRGDRQRWQASRGGYWTAAQSLQTCSSKRPSAAAAVMPERQPPARPRRQVHLPGAQDRVLAPGLHQRHGHQALPRITAPVHRQRS